jgi:hypothetical protein
LGFGGEINQNVNWAIPWAANDFAIIEGVLVATGTGTLALYWAQQGLNATATTLGIGSYMTLLQLS